MAAFTERKQGLHDMICDTPGGRPLAYTDQPHLQRRELGTVTIVILVLTGLLMLAGLALLVAAVGFHRQDGLLNGHPHAWLLDSGWPGVIPLIVKPERPAHYRAFSVLICPWPLH